MLTTAMLPALPMAESALRGAPSPRQVSWNWLSCVASTQQSTRHGEQAQGSFWEGKVESIIGTTGQPLARGSSLVWCSMLYPGQERPGFTSIFK